MTPRTSNRCWWFAAPKSVVEQRLPSSVGTVTADGRSHCILEAGGQHLGAMAMHLGVLPWEMEVLGPPELREIMRQQAGRMLRAATNADAGEATRPLEG